MNRSDYLKQDIQKKTEKLRTISSKGWEQFIREKIDQWDYAAFQEWKITPSEEKDHIDRLQVQGRAADEIREWADKEQILNELRGQQEDLKEIEEGNSEDAPMGQAGPVQENPKMSLWRKIREKMGE